MVGVDDPDGVLARAGGLGPGAVLRSEEDGRPVVRLGSPEGLTVRVCGPDPEPERIRSVSRNG